MCLYSDRSIRDVCDHLKLVLPKSKSLAPSAIPKARYRLGAEPLEWLFRRYTDEYAVQPERGGFAGLSLFAVDGTTLRVPDSDANYEAFGKPGTRNKSDEGGYPQVRSVALMALDTRMLVDVSSGPYRSSELSLTSTLWKSLSDNSITLMDRGFQSYANLCDVVASGQNRHVLVRLQKSRKFVPQRGLLDGSLVGHFVRPGNASKDLPETLEGRVIHYKHPDGEECRLFTTLLDSDDAPADRLVKLYHQRWDLEIAFDELKTHLRFRRESLRSKKPDGVRQELWGIFLLYNLVRFEMLGAADAHQVHPNRISFWSSLHVIRNFWMMSAQTSAPGNLPRQLVDFHSTFNALLLPRRRSERRFPRHVKIKMSNYPRNRGKRRTEPIEEAEESA